MNWTVILMFVLGCLTIEGVANHICYAIVKCKGLEVLKACHSQDENLRVGEICK